MATYSEIAKGDIQELFNDRKTMNQLMKLKLTKNIQDCPQGKDLWTAMAHLVETWDKILEIEEMKNTLVDYADPIAVSNRIKEIKTIFNKMKFPKWGEE